MDEGGQEPCLHDPGEGDGVLGVDGGGEPTQEAEDLYEDGEGGVVGLEGGQPTDKAEHSHHHTGQTDTRVALLV